MTCSLCVGIVGPSQRLATQVVLRWNMQRGVPVVLNSSEVAPNVASLLAWRLTYEHKAMLDRLGDGTRVLAPTWCTFADPEEGGAVKPRILLGSS